MGKSRSGETALSEIHGGIYMEMTVFRTKVQRAVSEALGEEYSVELREVQKNNGVILQGLMIRRAQENMMPTIYLNSFLKAYPEDRYGVQRRCRGKTDRYLIFHGF